MNFYIQKYKKWLVLLLCISFLIPQNVGLNTVLAATKGVCTATKLMIRQGPGTDYAPVKVGGEDAYLVTNQVVDIISSEKGWYKLKAKFNGTDVEGYSSGAYIKEAANAGDTDVKTTQKGICTAATLMIRTGPATTYASVTVNGVAAYLTNGQSVEILGSENGWYKIKTVFGATEIEGYSSGSYISVVGTDAKITVTAAPAATEKPAATPKVTATPKPTSKPMATPKPTATPAPVYELKVSAKISATTLNVRETAGKSGKLLTTLSKGTAVTVIGETKSGTEIWYKVTVKVEKKTITGYVLSDYVALTVRNGFYGNILQNNITPVTVAGGNKAVKLADGSFWMVNKGNTWISEEVIVSGVKWFRIGQNIGGTAYRGYVTANKVELLGKKLPTPTPAKTPEPTAAVTPKPTAQPTKAPVPDTSKLDPEEDFEIPAEVIATSLNVRSKASTSSDILATLTQGHQLTVLNEADAGNETWYRVAVTVDKKLIIGYVYEPYVKFVLTLPVEALIAGSKMKVKSKPDTNSANLTGTDKAEIVLNKGIKVSIVEDVKVDYVRWLGIQFTLSNKEYKGYVTVNQIDLLIPTAAPTPSAAPTPTETPTPSATPTVEPTKAPTPTPALTTNRAVIKDAAALVIRQEAGYSGNIVSDSAGSAVLLRTGQELMLLSVKKVDGILWYQTSFQYGNGTYTGYVNEKYVELKEPDASLFPNASPTPVPTVIPVDDKDFEASLTAQKFPESYKPYLRELHSMYPNWKFVAYHTGLDWNTVLDNEGIAGTNLIPNSKGIEWKSLGAGAYNWKTDSFIVYDGSTWVTASREAIAYYMDPRNFLTENGIFQFEVLTYQTAYQNLEGVESILNNTPLYKTKYTYTNDTGQAVAATYAETFIKAAEYSGVSPYHLASRVKQEVVTGTTSVSNSVTGTVAGFEGMYNFYNIGAYHSTAPGGAIANGLKYAKNGTTNAALNLNSLIPWDNRYSAIVGGAYIIGNSYINKGQDTIYLQKFNVTSVSTYAHQYMANVEAPYAEAKKVFTAYSNVSELPIVFSIPVYLNMPSKAAVIPATKRNPNNWLSTLKVTDVDGKDLILTPTFDISIDQEYNLVVGSNVEMINVVATAVSKKATVSGNGFYSLSTGKNLVLVYVIAEDGSIREYKINIVRE